MLKQAKSHPWFPLTREYAQSSLASFSPFSTCIPPTGHSLGLTVSVPITSTTSNLCLWKVPSHPPRSSSNATSSGRPSWILDIQPASFSLLNPHDPWNCLCYGTWDFLPLDSQLLEGKIHVWFISGSPAGLSSVNPSQACRKG